MRLSHLIEDDYLGKGDRRPEDMDEDEFLKHHYTGHISSSAYKDYEDDISWLKKEKYPILLTVKNYKGHEIEFRQEDQILQYCSLDANKEIRRDERGMAIMMTPEEVKAKELQEKETTIGVFDGDRAVGFASDEWGATGVWVIKDYQKMGIGKDLLRMFDSQYKKERKMGQMTDAGVNLARSYHRSLKKT